MPLTPLKDSEAMMKEVDVLSKELDRLRLSYEQYFLGLEREEPVKLRETVFALIRKYSGTVAQNARLNFRIQQAIAKYNTYATYWNRILREIEEGRYTRDVFRAKLHDQERGQLKKDPPKAEDAMATLFNEYLEARKKCNETTKGLTFEGFRKSMTAQMEALKEKARGREVKFQVVTESGKTKIRAIPVPSKGGA
jgi:hypothetical protein